MAVTLCSGGVPAQQSRGIDQNYFDRGYFEYTPSTALLCTVFEFVVKREELLKDFRRNPTFSLVLKL